MILSQMNKDQLASFKSENEKKFYSSFLYCALTLCSLEFKYVPEEDPEHPFAFPVQYFDKKPDFRFVVENAVIETDPDDKTTLGLESYGMFHEGFTCLYKLLAGKEIELETVYTPVEISDREQQEIMDDLIEDTADLDDLSLYEENFFDEYDGDESDDGIDSEEIVELHELQVARHDVAHARAPYDVRDRGARRHKAELQVAARLGVVVFGTRARKHPKTEESLRWETDVLPQKGADAGHAGALHAASRRITIVKGGTLAVKHRPG